MMTHNIKYAKSLSSIYFTKRFMILENFFDFKFNRNMYYKYSATIDYPYVLCMEGKRRREKQHISSLTFKAK